MDHPRASFRLEVNAMTWSRLRIAIFGSACLAVGILIGLLLSGSAVLAQGGQIRAQQMATGSGTAVCFTYGSALSCVN
jgi:hypothetical protein